MILKHDIVCRNISKYILITHKNLTCLGSTLVLDLLLIPEKAGSSGYFPKWLFLWICEESASEKIYVSMYKVLFPWHLIINIFVAGSLES